MSDFDVRRLGVEVESLEVRAAELRTRLRAARTRIAALTGLEVPEPPWRFAPPDSQPQGPPPAEKARDSASGAATPTSGVPDREGLDVGTEAARAEVRAAAQRRRAADIRGELARREAVPDLVVTAGYSRLDPGLDGFVWSVNAVLPLFDRNRDEAAALAAEEAGLERRAEALALEARAQRLQALDEYRAATAALEDLDDAPGIDLVGVARVAYEEGEMSMVELLDAVEAELAAGIRRIELERRRAEQWFVWKWASGSERVVTR